MLRALVEGRSKNRLPKWQKCMLAAPAVVGAHAAKSPANRRKNYDLTTLAQSLLLLNQLDEGGMCQGRNAMAILKRRGVCGGSGMLGASLVALLLSGLAASAQAPVAGVNPDRRPEGAPKMTAPERSKGWYAKATAGVSKPIPPSLKFLDDQGGWFTPFDRPGMPGPYDIRKLHRN